MRHMEVNTLNLPLSIIQSHPYYMRGLSKRTFPILVRICTAAYVIRVIKMIVTGAVWAVSPKRHQWSRVAGQLRRNIGSHKRGALSVIGEVTLSGLACKQIRGISPTRKSPLTQGDST